MTTSFISLSLMTSDDKAFFVALGQRVAILRKERNMTQQELADQLGIAQQTLAHYEGARLRVPASMLPTLAGLLAVEIDELIGYQAKRANKRGPAPKLQKQLERVALLPRARQQVVMDMLDGVLAQRASR